ncbi:MAG: tRNA lysidine(34) synthetase TilS [Pseudomonadota bacterium]
MQLSPDLFTEYLKRNPGIIGVAVSGGSDSLSLLVALHEAGAEVQAATVDHGLRPEAAQEARHVAAICADLGVPHETLTAQVPGTGNLQAAARDVRYGLLTDWARCQQIATLAMGHTQDDQAETMLLRLGRGSGVDGLSAMAMESQRGDLRLWRPLLGQRRTDLQVFLSERQIKWVDDPSNDDHTFDRVRARKALETLAELGITTEKLADTATRMRRARGALEAATLALAKSAAQPNDIGAVQLDLPALQSAPAELRLRLLSHALCWVSSSVYRPRALSLDSLWHAVTGGKNHTLHGCIVSPKRGETIEVTRETVAMPVGEAGGVYDGRWVCDSSDGEVGPLTAAGLALCPGWRAMPYSRAALEASPAIWRDRELLCAPFAGMVGPWQCGLKDGPGSFFSSIVTH